MNILKLLAFSAAGRGVTLPREFKRQALLFAVKPRHELHAAFVNAEDVIVARLLEARTPKQNRLAELERNAKSAGRRKAMAVTALPAFPAQQAEANPSLPFPACGAPAAYTEAHSPNAVKQAKREEARRAKEAARAAKAAAYAQFEADCAAEAEELKQLREELNQLPLLSWDDPNSTRETIIEMMKRSYFKSLTVFDPCGNRIFRSVTNKSRMILEGDMAQLSSGESNAVSMIRASATGGANIHSMAGDEKPALHYYSSLSEELAERLMHKFTKKSNLSGLKGYSLVLRDDTADYGEINTEALRDYFLELMQSVAALGREEVAKRLHVEFEADAAADWKAFLDGKTILADAGHDTQYARRCLDKAEANAQTIAVMAGRVIVMDAITAMMRAAQADPTHVGSWASGKTISLGLGALSAAKAVATSMLKQSYGMRSVFARKQNADSCTVKKQATPEELAHLAGILEHAIRRESTGIISRKRVLALPGMTAGRLEALLAAVPQFIELSGKDEINQGTIKRAYTLRSVVHYDPAESGAEFEAAVAADQEDPNAVSDVQAAELIGELQEQATDNDKRYQQPVVPLSQLTAAQMEALPKALRMFPGEIALREAGAEPEHIYTEAPGGEDVDLVKRNTATIWVRYDTKGTPMRNWSMCARLGFADRWPVAPRQFDEAEHTHGSDAHEAHQ